MCIADWRNYPTEPRGKKLKALLLLFITMPIVEMLVLFEVGGAIGPLPTVGLVLLTAVVGLSLLKRQGMSTLLNAQEKLKSGELPVNELASGIFLAVGGALLLTPGFVTDTIGFCCLIPGLRQLLIGRLVTMIKPNIVAFSQAGGGGARGTEDNRQGSIDAEYTRDD